MATEPHNAFSCACGAVTGHIRDLGPKRAVRLRCHCPDCRAGELYFNQPDPGADGVDIVQIAPSDVTFKSGQEHLRVLRLYPSGLLRWYAGCCETPLFNTVATPKVGLIGMMTQRLADPDQAGPVRARAFVPHRSGKRRHKNMLRLIIPFLRNTIARLISGAWRDTPFFDLETKRPIAKPTVLTEEERRALGLGPKRFPSV